MCLCYSACVADRWTCVVEKCVSSRSVTNGALIQRVPSKRLNLCYKYYLSWFCKSKRTHLQCECVWPWNILLTWKLCDVIRASCKCSFYRLCVFIMFQVHVPMTKLLINYCNYIFKQNKSKKTDTACMCPASVYVSCACMCVPEIRSLKASALH